ncbi:MAG: hypothetical protein R3268_09270 [Acidiferrobacterales bacterium]|nr:hypothetical protein [Acidiferrobacterales bacterium]
MSDTVLLAVAVLAFVLMAIGLLLTMREFAHGQPKREEADPRGAAPKSRGIQST